MDFKIGDIVIAIRAVSHLRVGDVCEVIAVSSWNQIVVIHNPEQENYRYPIYMSAHEAVLAKRLTPLEKALYGL